VGFRSSAELVQRAKDILVAAVPSPRGAPGVPLAEAVLAFEATLRDAVGSMDRWRGGDVERQWRACRRAIADSLTRAERLRLEAPELDYEGLVDALADLLDPLDAFAEAERDLSRRS
jgi:hypothetical protein